ncbi:MAG: YdeI/OmpD-associated family protein [Bacteroidales bacterium]|jgi:uncharacterized protein YdeI (YjbR/CyaY-like superfamily)|nr:YdeI/OmpD-associated family protein [Bacteroidales bacterium]
MEPEYFKSQDEFREWLGLNHGSASEIIVGFYKVKSKRFNMTWSQSVDQAICFGWIDGIRRSIDDERYCIRFTPRNPKSAWSNVNIKKAEELTAKGLMAPAGTKAFNIRKNEKSGIYSFENDSREMPDSLRKLLISDEEAWEFFTKQAPSYRKTINHWILSAKQEKTRLSRVEKLISLCREGKRLY